MVSRKRPIASRFFGRSVANTRPAILLNTNLPLADFSELRPVSTSVRRFVASVPEIDADDPPPPPPPATAPPPIPAPPPAKLTLPPALELAVTERLRVRCVVM